MSSTLATSTLAVLLASVFGFADATSAHAQSTSVSGILLYEGKADDLGAVFALSAQQYGTFARCVANTDAADCLNGDYTYREDVENDGSGNFQFDAIPQGYWYFVGLDAAKSHKEYDSTYQNCSGGPVTGVRLNIH